MIGVPRIIVVALAAAFSAYHVVLGLASLATPSMAGPVIVAMVLYATATTLSLVPGRARLLPTWIAAVDLAVAVVMPLLVCAVLQPDADNGYATWYVAAVGTLMTIVAVRGRFVIAWVGVGFLTVQSLVWAGLGSFATLGVIGSLVWVAVAQVTTVTTARAARDTAAFAVAEREASELQAAQDAHLVERQVRLESTTRIAAPMLRRIVDSRGTLDAAGREECRQLEAAIRDEIRGRMLLDDGVREAVRAARMRGAAVTLLDEGGLDDLDDTSRTRVLDSLSQAISSTDAERIIVRTVAPGSLAAVTVVGRGPVGEAEALGVDSGDDVRLWLEIPRG
ncbi:hypothetical protein E6C70_00330 [Glaciibacter flavus]|uniref:Uncharacterized protein n=1 Tax=Orlajensenia flava TaxID=2565934 RepID=A0A4S4G1M1_9MICO|nr:hypothetical protein [Glaciibacter flavus]THG36412.1 hypothetical protein E6C70_00330 [Glaciibacter flavus]